MRTGIVLTKKEGGIPQLELKGIATRLKAKWRRTDSYFYLSDVPLWRARELAYARVVGRYWFSFRRYHELAQKSRKLREYTLKFGTFSVEGTLKDRVGWWLDGRVDLSKPRQLIYVYKGKKRYHVLSDAKIIRGKDFSWRDAKNRPVFHPSSLNARDARFLVNVGGVMPGDTVLDPFCGVGGILIEAGLLGARIVGIDVDRKMVEGCRKNLEHYGIKGNVINGDARKVDVEEVDVVVTDPPYGRSSKITSKNLKELYLDVLERLHPIVKDRLVILLPFEGEGILERAGFQVLGKARWYVHSSLTRRVYMCSP